MSVTEADELGGGAQNELGESLSLEDLLGDLDEVVADFVEDVVGGDYE